MAALALRRPRAVAKVYSPPRETLDQERDGLFITGKAERNARCGAFLGPLGLHEQPTKQDA